MSNNLRLVKEYTTSVATNTLTYTDLFSSDYDVHQVIMTGDGVSGEAGGHLRVVNSSGGVLRTSTYNWAMRYMKGNAGDGDLQSNGATDWANCGGNYSTNGGTWVWYIFNAMDADKYTYFVGYGTTENSSDVRAYRIGGCFTSKETITGLSLAMDQTMTGTIRSYGLRVDT